MEPAKIDWKRVESIFIKDKLYENINAPKWVDLLAPNDSFEDDSWFCRPDCNHPKTAEDFLRTTPTSKVLPISADRSKTPLGSWNQRDARLKRGGQNRHSLKSSEDCENQNSNFSTPSDHQGISLIKSCTQKKKPAAGILGKDEAFSTVSVRNLIGGRDILSQITEFCNELKKLTTSVRERGDDNDKLKEEEEDQVLEGKDEGVVLEKF